MSARRILTLSGRDTEPFLQGLITNDVARLEDGLVYAALLTPQGKYIADFFLLRHGDAVLLDVAERLADDLKKRLTMYRLRAEVAISDSDLHVQRGTGTPPADAVADPRHPALGWRRYTPDAPGDDGSDWDAIRVSQCIPETGIELTPDTFILEMGFDVLNGVDFRKGCYVGQEVTARMRHKTELRKGLRRVRIDGTAPAGTPIDAAGKAAGTLFTQAGGHALAHLRFDRIADTMTAGDATLWPV